MTAFYRKHRKTLLAKPGLPGRTLHEHIWSGFDVVKNPGIILGSRIYTILEENDKYHVAPGYWPQPGKLGFFIEA